MRSHLPSGSGVGRIRLVVRRIVVCSRIDSDVVRRFDVPRRILRGDVFLCLVDDDSILDIRIRGGIVVRACIARVRLVLASVRKRRAVGDLCGCQRPPQTGEGHPLALPIAGQTASVVIVGSLAYEY